MTESDELMCESCLTDELDQTIKAYSRAKRKRETAKQTLDTLEKNARNLLNALGVDKYISPVGKVTVVKRKIDVMPAELKVKIKALTEIAKADGSMGVSESDYVKFTVN